MTLNQAIEEAKKRSAPISESEKAYTVTTDNGNNIVFVWNNFKYFAQTSTPDKEYAQKVEDFYNGKITKNEYYEFKRKRSQ